ncbi:hypothetical protein [Streptomyces sp. NPDC058572]|uniref:hypothetical protein n=1 Tax=Streptomyces sp. NPDC058572 TaxID=3346546 RepID=UPI00364DBBEC
MESMNIWPSYVERALRELGPATGSYMVQITDEFVDEFAPAGREDLVLRYARPVSIHVTAGLLGMDERYAADIGMSLPALMGRSSHRERAHKTLESACERLVAEKAQAAGPDLVSWMLHHAPPERDADIPSQVHRLLLGITATATSRTILELSRCIPSPGGRATDPASGDTVGTQRALPIGAQRVVGLLVATAVERILSRLPDVRLRMPLTEVLWEPVLGVRCPQSLPAVFSPVRMRYPVVEIDRLPAPAFTTIPPL